MLDAWLDLVTGSSCVGCHRPGRLLCVRCRERLPREGRESRPQPCPAGLARARVGGDYADLLRAMVLAHKERRAFGLVDPLGQVLATAVRGLLPGDVHIGLVPVPSRSAVVAARGHDPTLRVTREAVARLRGVGHDVALTRLLRQRGRVTDQAGLDAAGRQRNLVRSMAARRSALAALARGGVPVVAIVCDDVLTTGSTAREAQRALEAVGVPVAGIACVAATRRRCQVPTLAKPVPTD